MSDGAMGTQMKNIVSPQGGIPMPRGYRPHRTPPKNAALTGSDRIRQRIPMARPHMGYRNSAPSALGGWVHVGHNDGGVIAALPLNCKFGNFSIFFELYP